MKPGERKTTNNGSQTKVEAASQPQNDVFSGGCAERRNAVSAAPLSDESWKNDGTGWSFETGVQE